VKGSTPEGWPNLKRWQEKFSVKVGSAYDFGSYFYANKEPKMSARGEEWRIIIDS
jgi:hypothetical protein